MSQLPGIGGRTERGRAEPRHFGSELIFGGLAFPSTLTSTIARVLPAAVPRGPFDALFRAFFPDDCRLCERELTRITAVPVCGPCLEGIASRRATAGCLHCGHPFEDAEKALDRCGACRVDPPSFDRARSFGTYEGDLRRLIHLMKYDGMRPLAKRLGRLMAATADDFEALDYLVPVPLYRRRRWSRGFNQAGLLAAAMAEATDIPARGGLLRRTRATESQAGLSNQQRRSNVAGAFSAPRPGEVRGRRILLIDDVMTTGATLEACAKALKRAGARYVGAVTSARAKRRMIEVGGATRRVEARQAAAGSASEPW